MLMVKSVKQKNEVVSWARMFIAHGWHQATGEGIMAIFGVGAYYEEDVSQAFIQANLVGVGWDATDAPELHQFMRSLKVGDIV
jgi:hypothetical protein